MILSHCITEDSHLNFQLLGVHVAYVQCLSARPSLLPRLQKQQGQSETVQGRRSELCKICCGCFTVLFVLSYYLSMHPATQLPFPRHLVLFWYVTIYTTLSPLVIFGALFVPKVSWSLIEFTVHGYLLATTLGYQRK